jgi:hypothetical protein
MSRGIVFKLRQTRDSGLTFTCVRAAGDLETSAGRVRVHTVDFGFEEVGQSARESSRCWISIVFIGLVV